ncbi:MAG: hypothetical protein AAGA27_04405 [Pseudomonadota bacterium]
MIKTMTASFLILPFLLLLTACSGGGHIDKLVANPAELNKQLTQCQQKDSDATRCAEVKQAYKQLASYLIIYQQKGQENFGKMIMAAQSKTVQLTEQLKQANTSASNQKLQQQLEQTERQIHIMWSITAMTENPDKIAALRALFAQHPVPN